LPKDARDESCPRELRAALSAATDLA
jgi:hypothetical protein